MPQFILIEIDRFPELFLSQISATVHVNFSRASNMQVMKLLLSGVQSGPFNTSDFRNSEINFGFQRISILAVFIIAHDTL